MKGEIRRRKESKVIGGKDYTAGTDEREAKNKEDRRAEGRVKRGKD